VEIYDAIVNGFKANIPANTGIEGYLQSLQKSVKSLRIAYRNSPVFVPYEKTDIQAAYLATYLPHYYQLIYKIFIEEVPDIFKNKNEIHLTFIGGGPGSEAYGALKYIFNNCVEAKDIFVTILDINASTWNYSHSIVQENLVDAINSREATIHWKSVQFDLVSDIDTKKVKSIIEKSNLLVIQNCLNEIASTNLPALKTNLKLLFEYLPGTSYLLMSDLTSGARPVIKALEKYLVDNFVPNFIKSTLSFPSSRSLISVHHRPSSIIAQNLLVGTDGLIPRKNLSYDYSILSKGIIEEPIDYAALGFNALYRPLDFKNLDANDYIHKKIFIGIDFGTSSTVISTAQLVDGKIKIKPIPIKQKDHLGNSTSDPLVPSVISFVNMNILIGKYANQFKSNLFLGKNTWYAFKQNLVNLDQVEYPDSDLRSFNSFKISNATDALIHFFSFIKHKTIEYLNENHLPTDVEYCISVPAGYSSKEKQTLKFCLAKAEIYCEDTPFIEEPNAAMINFLFEQNIYVEKNDPKNVLVLDLGAGTVDVSILRAENAEEGFTSKILSVVRIGHIGGNLIDEKLADLIIKQKSLINKINEAQRNELVSLCEILKIKLCSEIITDSLVNYELPVLCNSHETRFISTTSTLNEVGLNNIQISFVEFNDIMLEYWHGGSGHNGVKDTIDQAIKNASIFSTDINKVIITGGGGRNPYIKNHMARYFVASDVFISDNIQEQVSRGVALHSFVLNSFGKNIITPILGHDIRIMGANKSILLFENGINVPSMDVEVEVENSNQSLDRLIVCTSEENKGYRKCFLCPSNIDVSKLVFYINPDQELSCELIGTMHESMASEVYNIEETTLIQLK
jgi:molecular chaperone DnaK (HSP70)